MLWHNSRNDLKMVCMVSELMMRVVGASGT